VLIIVFILLTRKCVTVIPGRFDSFEICFQTSRTLLFRSLSVSCRRSNCLSNFSIACKLVLRVFDGNVVSIFIAWFQPRLWTVADLFSFYIALNATNALSVLLAVIHKRHDDAPDYGQVKQIYLIYWFDRTRFRLAAHTMFVWNHIDIWKRTATASPRRVLGNHTFIVFSIRFHPQPQYSRLRRAVLKRYDGTTTRAGTPCIRTFFLLRTPTGAHVTLLLPLLPWSFCTRTVNNDVTAPSRRRGIIARAHAPRQWSLISNNSRYKSTASTRRATAAIPECRPARSAHVRSYFLRAPPSPPPALLRHAQRNTCRENARLGQAGDRCSRAVPENGSPGHGISFVRGVHDRQRPCFAALE